MRKPSTITWALISLIPFSGVAQAHGFHVSNHGIQNNQGLLHAFTGLDHLALAFGLGVLSMRLGGKMLGGVPLLFCLSAAGSILFGPQFDNVLPEYASIVSVIAIGVFMLLPRPKAQNSLGICAAVVLCGCLQGAVHTGENVSVGLSVASLVSTLLAALFVLSFGMMITRVAQIVAIERVLYRLVAVAAVLCIVAPCLLG